MTEVGKLRKERREARIQADSNDRPAALELCRMIRDDAGASYADRLRAVELIQQIKGG
jgi:hypothetical protein